MRPDEIINEEGRVVKKGFTRGLRRNFTERGQAQKRQHSSGSTPPARRGWSGERSIEGTVSSSPTNQKEGRFVGQTSSPGRSPGHQ